MDTLKWSTNLLVTHPKHSPTLPGDKITLPQSALEQLLAAAPLQSIPSTSTSTSHSTPNSSSTFDPFNPHTFAAESRARQYQEESQRQHQLPHPLTFRIVNPKNGRAVYAGIREFSAAEGEISLSSLLRDSLGVEDGEFEIAQDTASQGEAQAHAQVDNEEAETETETNGEAANTNPRVTIHANQLPKGTYVRLRPLEAGYDPEDWKALLERHLRDNFTTLTVGELLTVPSSRTESFRFLVDKVYPEGEGICVVDTDLEVDIVALSEEQARETLQKRLEKAARAPGTTNGSSVGGVLSIGEVVRAQVLEGEYVDYEVKLQGDGGIRVEMEMEDGHGDEERICLFGSPLSTRQRGRPRRDMHVWGDFSDAETKKFSIRPTNVALEGAESIYISVYADIRDEGESETETKVQTRIPVKYNLRISIDDSDIAEPESTSQPQDEMHDADDVQCQNCQQWVPQRTLVLHENFCLRNNIFCTQCSTVFQKRSPEWSNHWHCPHDSAHGINASSQTHHNSIFHTTHPCPDCPEILSNLPALATHRVTDCPGKLILCQFCHLLVPQKSESDPDFFDPEVLVSGLTPHELSDGARTTECHLCGKIIRLRDMNTHLRHHELERISRPAPKICLNQNCGRTLQAAGAAAATGTGKNLGLCNICFGPLYVDTHDPEGKALRRRIERRYLSQMMSGCGKEWCLNEYCKNGKVKRSDHGDAGSAGAPGALSVAEIMKITRPLVEALSLKPDTTNTAPFYFCTDETGQYRRNIAEMVYAQGQTGQQNGDDGKAYDLAWCVAGAEAAGGDIEKMREWLEKWAPVKGESVR